MPTSAEAVILAQKVASGTASDEELLVVVRDTIATIVERINTPGVPPDFAQAVRVTAYLLSGFAVRYVGSSSAQEEMVVHTLQLLESLKNKVDPS